MDEIEENFLGSAGDFWKAAKIYYEHPNCMNRQILLSVHVFGGKLHSSCTSKDDFEELRGGIFDCFIESNRDLGRLKNDENLNSFLTKWDDLNAIFEHSCGSYLLVRKIIPKRNIDQSDFYELLLLDKERTKLCIYTQHSCKIEENNFQFIYKDPLSVLKYNYIELEYDTETLKLSFDRSLGEKGIHWLKVIFMPKFKNLMSNTIKKNSLGNIKNCSKNSQKVSFTNRVDIVQYSKLYEKMKLKYAEFLIKNWSENSDPRKFVHEDIGIATYLMLLWGSENSPQERSKKQKFVDLGCGNGLLVHILNSEGHQGIGLDLRKRKIWDTYPSNTVLREEIVIPTQNTIYPEADWLIGNHSDELTAWLPIMARNSNGHCQYFVLPCCPYQLNGQKFQRKNSNLSSYQDFINYVKDISEMCDFETYIDRLRIPSTKRVCLIGLRKLNSTQEKNDLVSEKILNFIKNNCQSTCDISHESIYEEKQGTLKTEPITKPLNFKVRESVEKVKNCTKLPQIVIDEILKTISNVLLKEECNELVLRNNSQCNWNRGRKLAIEELAKAIDKELLMQLKKECKGLQTLLKNHHYLFEVSQGFVQFRSPKNLQTICHHLQQNQNQAKWKKRICWFHFNHPDRCPLSDSICCYNHAT